MKPVAKYETGDKKHRQRVCELAYPDKVVCYPRKYFVILYSDAEVFEEDSC